MRTRAAASPLLALLVVVAAACSQPVASADGSISASDAWARPGAAGATSATYLSITNGTDEGDTLVGASTAAAADVSVHQTTTDQGGMTGMHEATLAIPAGRAVTLEPGGYHVMLMDLTDDLVAGSQFEITLTFEHAGPVVVPVQVRAG